VRRWREEKTEVTGGAGQRRITSVPLPSTRVHATATHLVGQHHRRQRLLIGLKLTTLSREQADYIGVPVEGPYKPDFYRY